MADAYAGLTTWLPGALMPLLVDSVKGEHMSVQKLDVANRTACWPTRALDR
jgi:hypothetical protein